MIIISRKAYIDQIILYYNIVIISIRDNIVLDKQLDSDLYNDLRRSSLKKNSYHYIIN